MTTINYWRGTSSNEWDDAANWSTSIADGQIAVLNEGSNPIEGGTFTVGLYADWSAIYVGPGFTGSIGTKLDPLNIATTALVVGGGTSVYMGLYDSTADGASVPRVLTLHNWPATVNIQDFRTATTLNVRVLAASGAISTATLSFDQAITTFIASGLTVETVSVVGEDIGTLRVDGGVVQGGDVTGTAHISGGTWESGDAANLILYGGQVLGGVGRETVIGSLIMMGGAFSLEQATGYNVQLPSVIALYPFATLDLRTDGIRPTCSVYFPGGGTVRVPASTTVTAS